jgi:hypothetical protein
VNSKPLVVNLDGTLVLTDSLHESVVRAVRHRPKFDDALTFNLDHSVEAVQDVFHQETKSDV